MDFSNKKILVAGAGRSGIASAAVLLKHGAEVTLADEKPANSFILPESLYGVKTRIGEEFLSDGSDFDLIVTSPGIPLFAPIFSIAKQRNIPVIGEIELGYLLCNCKIAAVTGTNGKTTTTTLLGEILAAHYDGSKTAGNIGVSFAGTAEEIPEDAYAAVEISSFQLETIKNFHPNVAACLNVTPDHLNRHGTIEVYAATKKRVFENQTEHDFAILNYDDNICREMAERLKSQIIFFSRKTDADICVKDGKIISKKHGVIIPVDEIPIPGVHNIENVLAAVALSLCCDVPVDVIRCIVRNFSGVEHRIEFVREINGVKYYNDSKATNVDSALVALDALAAPLIVIAGGRDKDLDFKPFAQKLKERTKLLVLIGETAQKISVACDNEGFHEYIFAASMKNAVDICRKNAVKGDCVLLSPACASFDMFTSYEHRGKVFKEAVNND